MTELDSTRKCLDLLEQFKQEYYKLNGICEYFPKDIEDDCMIVQTIESIEEIIECMQGHFNDHLETLKNALYPTKT